MEAFWQARPRPDPALWDAPRTWNLGSAPTPMKNRCLGMGRPGRVNREAILLGEYGEALLSNMEDYIRFPDETDPALLARIKSAGLQKHLMRADDPFEKWSLYLPADLDESGRARYPLLLLFHGATMPIHFEEHTGWLPVCAREKIIMVCPQNHSPENALSILAEMMARYPVDASRVYLAGYSQGAIQLNALSARCPERFAAVAPCGMHLFASPSMAEDADVRRMRAFRLPCVAVCGQEESLEEFPVCLDSACRRPAFAFERAAEGDPTLRAMADMRWLPATAEDKLAMLNRRLDTVGHRRLTLAQCLESQAAPDPAARALGVIPDRARTETLLGVRHFFGDFLDGTGAPVLRLISVEGMNHWPPAAMAELCWAFMRRFRRAEDGSVAVDGN